MNNFNTLNDNKLNIGMSNCKKLTNNYNFKAHFIRQAFNTRLLLMVVPVCEKIFNALPRKTGHKKYITVKINDVEKCLDIELSSDRCIDQINYLRAIQYFSKILSVQPGMSGYIVDGRLLVQ